MPYKNHYLTTLVNIHIASRYGRPALDRCSRRDSTSSIPVVVSRHKAIPRLWLPASLYLLHDRQGWRKCKGIVRNNPCPCSRSQKKGRRYINLCGLLKFSVINLTYFVKIPPGRLQFDRARTHLHRQPNGRMRCISKMFLGGKIHTRSLVLDNYSVKCTRAQFE